MKKQNVTAIDINFKGKKPVGTAYYRIPKHFKDFLQKCNETNGIVGFEFEDGSFNFGVIINVKRRSISKK